MMNQVSVKPYDRPMPDMPAGVVPTTGRLATLTQRESQAKVNPVQRTPAVVSNGKIFYGYYCLMCHGENGDGNGPVGEAYVPKPTDLTSPAVTRLTDGQLYSRMLHGTGHDPVMSQTVLPEHRWPLVHYLRTMSLLPAPVAEK